MKLESSLRDHAGFLYTAPLVDVVLLLLIFFLLGSSFVLKSGILVDVPAAAGSLPPIEAAHVITVTQGSSPTIYFNEHDVTLGDLETRLVESKVSRPDIRHVILRGDRMAPYGVIITISDLVKRQNFELALAAGSE